MPSLKERVTSTISRLRKRRPIVDHAVRTQEHYGTAGGSQQAGAVTYFAFLSFFPILALAFFVVGQIAKVYPQARTNLLDAIEAVFPNVVGSDEGEISVQSIENAANTAGILGAIGLLYAGLGWLSATRGALAVVFEQDAEAHPNFVVGKLRDLMSLVVIGAVLMVSVALAGFVTGYGDVVLDWLEIDTELGWLVTLIGRMIAFGATMMLFFSLFKLLARPQAPNSSLWSGAFLGAIAFEILKALSFVLLGATKGSPAFQAFGIALILLVWMNYFSRVILYAASWAHTSAPARAIREQAALDRARMEQLTRVDLHEAAEPEPMSARGRSARTFAAGGATALALVAVLRRKKDQSP